MPKRDPSNTQSTDRLCEGKEPLIVWIDDRVQETDHRLPRVRSPGIRVILLSSTAGAKFWIKGHEGEHLQLWAYSSFLIAPDALRKLESSGRLQFITDNVRWEKTAASESIVMNCSAGETMLRFLRGNRFMAPVLVYCGTTIGATGFVKTYSNAVSSSSYPVFKDFTTMALGSNKPIKEAWNSKSRLSSGLNTRKLVS
jgi:hypothetical protein